MGTVNGIEENTKNKKPVVSKTDDLFELRIDIPVNLTVHNVQYPTGFTQDNTRVIAVSLQECTHTDNTGLFVEMASDVHPLGCGVDIGLNVSLGLQHIGVMFEKAGAYRIRLLLMRYE